MYLCLLVVGMACMWGRRNVATLYRSPDAGHHRTRFCNDLLVERSDSEAVLRQKDPASLRARRPEGGETLYWCIDLSKTVTVQGQWTHKRVADVPTATAQDQLRALQWEDLIPYVKEKPRGRPVLGELERLRVP